MKGPLAVTKTYRLGSKALVEQNSTPAEVAGVSHTVQLRTIYDLDKKESYSWDPLNNSATCVMGSYDKGWGDPFAGAGDLIKKGAKQVGTETMDGFQTRILELDRACEEDQGVGGYADGDGGEAGSHGGGQHGAHAAGGDECEPDTAAGIAVRFAGDMRRER